MAAPTVSGLNANDTVSGLSEVYTNANANVTSAAKAIFVSAGTASGGGAVYQFAQGGGESLFTTGLTNPFGMAFDSKGYLYVADAGSGRIMRFSPSGSESIFPRYFRRKLHRSGF